MRSVSVPVAASLGVMKDALPELTDEQLDADGDGSVTPADIRILRNRGVKASSIEAALEKMQARLTNPEQVEAISQLRSAIEPPQGAMQLQGWGGPWHWGWWAHSGCAEPGL